MDSGTKTDRARAAEAVRRACLAAARDAYEDAGLSGLCAEGRWEAALSAVARLDLARVLEDADSGAPPESARDAEGAAGAEQSSLRETREMEERVVLVDEQDRELGTEEKQRAHLDGRLHRALSVFVLNDRGELLLQRRAAAKYHSGGQWTNTCCSHPRPGEPVEAAARRRLREEMGVECPLAPAFTFLYHADVGGGLVEHEYDHVFAGRCGADPHPDPDEADDWRWASLDAAAAEAAAHPESFTPWLRLILSDPARLESLRRAAEQAETLGSGS